MVFHQFSVTARTACHVECWNTIVRRHLLVMYTNLYTFIMLVAHAINGRSACSLHIHLQIHSYYIDVDDKVIGQLSEMVHV